MRNVVVAVMVGVAAALSSFVVDDFLAVQSSSTGRIFVRLASLALQTDRQAFFPAVDFTMRTMGTSSPSLNKSSGCAT